MNLYERTTNSPWVDKTEITWDKRRRPHNRLYNDEVVHNGMYVGQVQMFGIPSPFSSTVTGRTRVSRGLVKLEEKNTKNKERV